MNTVERNRISVRLLTKVFSGGAFSTIALNRELSSLSDQRDRAYVSRVFYGVLAENVKLDYIISRLTQKRPKPVAAAVIKVGAYMLLFMNEPPYAVISSQVELIKAMGKGGMAGFVNAVLRRVGEVKLPINTGDPAFDLSVNASCPKWIADLLIADRGYEWTERFLTAKLPEGTHIRHNPAVTTCEALAAKLRGATPTPLGFYVSADEMRGLDPAEYTVQSLSSAICACYYAAGEKQGERVLDLCAAPGGKAVMLSELLGTEVVACDVHPRRVELIRSYAKRMRAAVRAEVNDATVRREDFIERFDLVVCDVPCSGIGVYKSKPDVLLSRKPGDIASLASLQYDILSAAADYVRHGGLLCYSTCTVTRAENEDVLRRFLAARKDFTAERAALPFAAADEDGFLRLTPQGSGCDGFFAGRLRRA